MKFIKEIFSFLILAGLNFTLKWFGINLLSFNHLPSLDFDDKIFIFICANFYYIVVCFIAFLLIKIRKNSNTKKIFKTIFNICLSLNVILFLFLYDYIFLFYPIFYYYLFKVCVGEFNIIRKFYLDFDSVKKYAFLFFILECPFLLFILLIEIFDKSNEPNAWWLAYYFTSNLIFYLPFFVLSWWDNRKLKMAE